MSVATLLVLTGCGGSPGAPAPGAAAAGAPARLEVGSPAFHNGGTIPAAYTCAGAGRRPALTWSGDWNGTTAVALVVDDPDAPGGDFYHWVVVDMPAGSTGVTDQIPASARQIKPWTPPCPPSGTHHYRFTVYGLDQAIGGAGLTAALATIAKHTVTSGRLTGLVAHHR